MAAQLLLQHKDIDLSMVDNDGYTALQRLIKTIHLPNVENRTRHNNDNLTDLSRFFLEFFDA